jgi:hypothetical protein
MQAIVYLPIMVIALKIMRDRTIMKTHLIMVLALVSVFLSGCFLAGLGVGAVGGGAAVHMYDTKPAPTPTPVVVQ